MATAVVRKQLSVNVNDENFLRLLLLIKKVGTAVCYNIFHRYFSKDKKILYQELLPYKNILKPLLFPSQYDLLYGDPNQETDSNTFDITLFLLLIRKTNGLQPPKRGWNRRPSVSDLSEAANLERLRIHRNSLSHTGAEPLKSPVYVKKWSDITTVLVNLGADKKEILNYATMQLESNGKANLEEEISILHDQLFHYIDVSFTKYSENEVKIDKLQDEITRLQDQCQLERLPLRDSEQYTLENLETLLKSKYLKSESLVSCLEWDIQHKGLFKLEDIYIDIHLSMWQQGKSSPVINKSFYDDIKRKSTTPVNMCVLSDPGKGKSILMKKIVMDYAQNKNDFTENMNDLTLVIFIRCKELLKYRSLQEYIEEVVLRDPSCRREYWIQLLEENCEKCLFLIDGLDEIYHQKAEIGEELHSLLEGNLYHGASIIATTRPSGLDTLEKQLALFTKCFVISTLTKEDIKLYISKYFLEKDEKYCNDLYEIIINNDDILELANSPMALSIICNIHDHTECVPQTMTELYHELVSQMIKQFKNHNGFGETRSGKRRVSECLLKSVGYVALNSLKEGNDYFEQEDLIDYFISKQKKKGFLYKARKWVSGINSTSVLQLGFITADRGSNPRKVNWRYQFEPKMCQKYIAAEYIVDHLVKHGIKGINKLFVNKTTKNVDSLTLLKDNHELCLFIVNSLGRRGEKEVCKDLFNKLFKGFGSL